MLQHLRLAVAEKIGELPIDPDHAASRALGQGHAHGGLLEQGPETLLALRQVGHHPGLPRFGAPMTDEQSGQQPKQ